MCRFFRKPYPHLVLYRTVCCAQGYQYYHQEKEYDRELHIRKITQLPQQVRITVVNVVPS